MFLRLLFVLHLSLLLLAYFFAAVHPFMSPGSFPLTSVAALGAPYVLAYAAVYFLLLSVWKRKIFWALLSIPALLWLDNVVATGRWKKPEGSIPLRVMTFNMQSLIRVAAYKGYPNPLRQSLDSFLRTRKADVLCIQEFTESGEPHLQSNLSLMRQAGYRYISFPVDSVYAAPEFNIRYGTLIASKYPIRRSLFRRFRPATQGEGVHLATVATPAGPVDVYTYHLSSMSLSVPRNDSRGLRNLKELANDVKATRSEIFRRIIRYSYIHEQESGVIRKFIDSTRQHQMLLCGDMNNVPNSYIYRTLKTGLSDAFVRSGTGLGKSYHTSLPTIRIDYIFCSPEFSPVHTWVTPYPFSDHFALCSDFLLPASAPGKDK